MTFDPRLPIGFSPTTPVFFTPRNHLEPAYMEGDAKEELFPDPTIYDMPREERELWFKSMQDESVLLPCKKKIEACYEDRARNYTKKFGSKEVGLEAMDVQAKKLLDASIHQDALQLVARLVEKVRSGVPLRQAYEAEAIMVRSFYFKPEHFPGLKCHETRSNNAQQLAGQIRLQKLWNQRKVENANKINKQETARREGLSSLGFIKFSYEKHGYNYLNKVTLETLLQHKAEYNDYLAEKRYAEVAAVAEKAEAEKAAAARKREKRQRRTHTQQQIEVEEVAPPPPAPPPPQLTPIQESINNMNDRLKPSAIFFKSRITDWFGDKDPRTINGFEDRNINQLKKLQVYKNVEGIDRLLSDLHFRENFCFPYQYLNKAGEIQTGLAFKARLNGVIGHYYTALDGSSRAFHSMFEPGEMFKFESAMAEDEVEPDQKAGDVWVSPFTTEFDVGKKGTVLWKQGFLDPDGQPRHRVPIICYPLNHQTAPAS